MDVVLNVEGMSCAHCKKAVQDAVHTLNGVSAVEVDVDNGKVNVTYDEAEIQLEKVTEVIENQGYDVAK